MAELRKKGAPRPFAVATDRTEPASNTTSLEPVRGAATRLVVAGFGVAVAVGGIYAWLGQTQAGATLSRDEVRETYDSVRTLLVRDANDAPVTPRPERNLPATVRVVPNPRPPIHARLGGVVMPTRDD